jgi:hypothetical protein
MRFPEKLHAAGDNSIQYAGALLGSGFRRSTFATLLFLDRERRWAPHVCETCEVQHLGHSTLWRGLLDLEVDDEYDYINHVLAEC